MHSDIDSLSVSTARPSWDLWFMRHAYVVAQRGSCLRKQVGAVVVRDRDQRIVASGYNGAPSGMPECLEVGCDVRVIDGRESCVRTLHAESNALDLLGDQDHGSMTLYVTVVTCKNCALRVLQNGKIRRVVYHEWYLSQGTQETAALLSAGVERLGIRYRVELVRLDVPLEMVRGSYGDPRALDEPH